ncbi:MAG: tetratricopeptide repeat protein, partial [Planctomycetota bacterium]
KMQIHSKHLDHLEKSPEKRYPSAKAFADDLDRLLSGTPISALPPTRKQRLQHWKTQHVRILQFSMIQMALILSGLIGLVFTQNKERNQLLERSYTNAMSFLSEYHERKRTPESNHADSLKLILNTLNAFNRVLQIDPKHLASKNYKKEIGLELFEFALQNQSYPLAEFVLQEIEPLEVSSEPEKINWRTQLKQVQKKQETALLRKLNAWIHLLKNQTVSKSQKADALFEVSKMSGEAVFQKICAEFQEGHLYFLTKIPTPPLQDFYYWIIEVLGRSENSRANALLMNELIDITKQQVLIQEGSRTLSRNNYMILLIQALANLKAVEYLAQIDKIRALMRPESTVSTRTEKALYKLIKAQTIPRFEDASTWSDSKFMQQIIFLEGTASNQETLQLCNKAISRYPKVCAFYNARGLLKRKLLDFSGALEDFNQAIDLPNPEKKEQAYLYYNRGLTKRDLKNYSEAILDIKKAIQFYPQFAEAYNELGSLFFNLNKPVEAMDSYNRTLKINPKHAFAYGNRGNLKLDQKDFKGAIIDYDQAIFLNPQHANFYDCRGSAKQNLGKLAEAIADYDQAIYLAPQDASNYYNRGNAKVLKKDFESALTDYTEAIRLRPGWISPYKNRGSAKGYSGDLDGAIADFTQSLLIEPEQGDTYYSRGQVYLLLKNEVSAKQDFKNFLKRSKNTKDPAYQSKRNQLIQQFPEWKDE